MKIVKIFDIISQSLSSLRYNTLHVSNWSVEVVNVIQRYQDIVIIEANRGYDGKDIPGYKKVVS